MLKRKRKFEPVITRSADELASALGLSSADATEMQVRRQINDKIVQVVARSGITHAQVARRANTSRSRVTALLNRNTAQISTDLMLRVLAALGYQARVTFRRVRDAA